MIRMENEPITSVEQLRATVYGFRRSRIILTSFELDLFTRLGDQAMTSQRLAKLIAADARATDRLLNALCVMGLVKKVRGQFANRKIARDFLMSGKPRYMAGLAHSLNQWQSWHTLSAAVRRGTKVYAREGDAAAEKRLPGFIAAMHDRAMRQAPIIVKQLSLAAVSQCLDIGAGSGAYAMALARAKKNIRVTAFDLPDVLPLTKEYVRRGGLLKRINFMAGDFRQDDWGKGYDLVLLSAIVHMNSAEENRRLIARAAESLNPGGQLIIQDFIMASERTRPAVGAFFALNMLVATARGDTFTRNEVRDWMQCAGLKKIDHLHTPFDAALMIGRKP
ncbi:MAG: methyltransferase domain-containing protein [Candidatus Aminicenantes bacterium]|nr:methyltransferase domain-containing protein [Candidatus Aminicenantes bacterium]